ncbi:Crp/Fnr family transcriptional regulator [Coriobacteriales bacterium OH1046]|nr:Crp/Fnr family transcriptional regulator [Coriobacteriales bacterium OH1046]
MGSLELANTFATALPFWDVLGEDDRALIVCASHEMSFAAGEQMSGAAAECLGGFVVLEGSVRVYLMSDEGREVTIVRLRPDEPCLMGASCVLRSIAFDVFLQAERDTRCILIAPQTLDAVFRRNLRAENWALNALVDRFSDIMWTLQQTLFASMDKRLAIFIYEECLRTGTDVVEMTQEQIARHLGSAREVVSRMLSYFSDEGIVNVGRGRLEVVDRVRLKGIALGA